MRFICLSLLILVFAVNPVLAQSIQDDLPPVIVEGTPDTPAAPAKPAPASVTVETCIVTDVNADVTADNASHARDNALMQAERSGLSQLQIRLGLPDTVAKMKDDDVAALVKSFELQSEKASATRYIGVFTIRFNPNAVQKRFGKAIAAAAAKDAATTDNAVPDAKADNTKPDKPKPTGPVAHLTVAVRADSLAAWGQIKNRIQAATPVVMIEVLDLGRGVSHVDLSYVGAVSDLQNALTDQGLVLRQNGIGVWEIYDGSIVPRQ